VDGSELAISKRPDTSYYKRQKTRKNAQVNEKLHENEETWVAQGHMTVRGRGHSHAPPTRGLGGPHDQPVVGSVPSSSFLLQHCVLCSFGASIWAAGFAYVGSF